MYFKLEEELKRRKDLGSKFLKVLQNQSNILKSEENEREKHQIAFMCDVGEIQRLINDWNISSEDFYNKDLHQQYVFIVVVFYKLLLLK